MGIPHQRFIEMIQYKAETVGINVILTEESYTSGTSFLDNEKPVKANYNKSRRVHRGLFISNNGIKNQCRCKWKFADNEKSISKCFFRWNRGCGVTSNSSRCCVSDIDE